MTAPTRTGKHVPATIYSAIFHANYEARTKNQYYAAREAAWLLEAIVTGEPRCHLHAELWRDMQR